VPFFSLWLASGTTHARLAGGSVFVGILTTRPLMGCSVVRVKGRKRDERLLLQDWRERYRATFHFRKGSLLAQGDRKKNEIIVRLDTSHFVAGTPSLALTGEVSPPIFSALSPCTVSVETVVEHNSIQPGDLERGVEQPHHPRYLRPL
jgi:hypothetical protein